MMDVSIRPCQLGGINTESEFTPVAEEFADYMINIFEAWLNLNNRDLKIREIDDIVGMLITGKKSVWCWFSGGNVCMNFLTLGSDGNVYACDWFMTDDFCGGNIKNMKLIEIIKNNKRKLYQKVMI